jgi:hypothetical protein
MIIYIKELNVLRIILLRREMTVRGYRGRLLETTGIYSAKMREVILRIYGPANLLRII